MEQNYAHSGYGELRQERKLPYIYFELMPKT
jgi:hypothetical protein